MTDTKVTRDEALLWLNDRLGRSVHASVKVDKGDYSLELLAVEGELRYWREDDQAGAFSAGYSRADITGLYEVGEGSLDLTDIAHKILTVRGDWPTLRVALAEDVTLEILEQRDLPDEEQERSGH